MKNILISLWKKKHSWDFTAGIAEYWLGCAVLVMSDIILFLMAVGVLSMKHGFGFFLLAFVVGALSIAHTLTFGLGWLSVAVRRAHDAGISGAWVCNPLGVFIVGFFPTKSQNNRYRASDKLCPLGHELHQGAIWCNSCQEIGEEPRLSFVA